MTEASNCYECDTPLVSVCPQCNPYLSASPSPQGDEVERVATAISMEVDAHGDPEPIERQRAQLEWRKYERHARAALSALPRRETVPTLTEEERARLALVRERHKNREEDGLSKAPLSSATLIVCHADRAILLSLIDKLTEAG